MKVLFRNVRSGKRRALLTELNSIARKELEQALDQEVKPALVKSHELVVANWEHKPGFASRKYVTPQLIALGVYPTGENAKIWTFVDQGTRPHPITARRAPRLIFQAGEYVPKTMARPARTVSGGGYVKNPKLVAPVTVQHPGTEAREFTVTIAEDIKPDFKRTIENVFRRISRQLEE